MPRCCITTAASLASSAARNAAVSSGASPSSTRAASDEWALTNAADSSVSSRIFAPRGEQHDRLFVVDLARYRHPPLVGLQHDRDRGELQYRSLHLSDANP